MPPGKFLIFEVTQPYFLYFLRPAGSDPRVGDGLT